MNDRELRATRGRLVRPLTTVACLLSLGGTALGQLQHKIVLDEAPAWITTKVDRLPGIVGFVGTACFAVAFFAFVVAAAMYVRSRQAS